MRVSAVGFLNAAPLVWGLRAGRHPADWEVALDAPSACARRLAAGDADVGLVPSIEFARAPDLRLAAPLCVAARRETTSVLLLCGGPLEGLRRVYLDPASRTSQALTRVLLARLLPEPPEYVTDTLPAGPLAATEAALVIGDRALKAHSARGLLEVDLAELWNRQTGLPFVFAVWAGRPCACTRGTSEVLESSHRYGVEHLEEIVVSGAASLGLEPGVIRRYLTRNLHYSLGPEEVRALELYFRLALQEEFPHERLCLPAAAGAEKGAELPSGTFSAR